MDYYFRQRIMSVNLDFFDNAPLVHIGYPKSLSKWLQKNLFIPEMGFIKCLNPGLVHELLVSKKPFQLDCQAIQGKVNFAIARAHKMFPPSQAMKLVPVVTSEALVGNMFCGGFDAELLAQRLAHTFPQAKILIVVREQRQMIRSLFSTAVAWGVPHKIEDFLSPRDENIAPQFSCDYLFYDALVAHYQEVFSKDRVVVVPYELFKNDPAAFVGKIMQFYPTIRDPAKFSELPFDAVVNQGQTVIETKAQRLINSLFLRTPFNYSGWFNDRDSWRIRRNTWRAPLSKNNYLVSCLEKRLARKIERLTMGRFSDSNKRLSQLTGTDFSAFGYQV